MTQSLLFILSVLVHCLLLLHDHPLLLDAKHTHIDGIVGITDLFQIASSQQSTSLVGIIEADSTAGRSEVLEYTKGPVCKFKNLSPAYCV